MRNDVKGLAAASGLKEDEEAYPGIPEPTLYSCEYLLPILVSIGLTNIQRDSNAPSDGSQLLPATRSVSAAEDSHLTRPKSNPIKDLFLEHELEDYPEPEAEKRNEKCQEGVKE